MHKGTSQGPELKYILGNVLGTQDRPAFRLAFICITFGLIWQIHLLSKPFTMQRNVY